MLVPVVSHLLVSLGVHFSVLSWWCREAPHCNFYSLLSWCCSCLWSTEMKTLRFITFHVMNTLYSIPSTSQVSLLLLPECPGCIPKILHRPLQPRQVLDDYELLNVPLRLAPSAFASSFFVFYFFVTATTDPPEQWRWNLNRGWAEVELSVILLTNRRYGADSTEKLD